MLELTTDKGQDPGPPVRALTTSQPDCLRTRIRLLRADGCSLRKVASHSEVSLPSVHK